MQSTGCRRSPARTSNARSGGATRRTPSGRAVPPRRYAPPASRLIAGRLGGRAAGATPPALCRRWFLAHHPQQRRRVWRWLGRYPRLVDVGGGLAERRFTGRLPPSRKTYMLNPTQAPLSDRRLGPIPGDGCPDIKALALRGAAGLRRVDRGGPAGRSALAALIATGDRDVDHPRSRRALGSGSLWEFGAESAATGEPCVTA